MYILVLTTLREREFELQFVTKFATKKLAFEKVKQEFNENVEYFEKYSKNGCSGELFEDHSGAVLYEHNDGIEEQTLIWMIYKV